MSIRLRRAVWSMAVVGMVMGGTVAAVHQSHGLTANASARTEQVTSRPMTRREAKNLARRDSFVILKATRYNRGLLSYNAQLLDRYNVKYGVYVANGSNSAGLAESAVDSAPNASFYMDAQPSVYGRINTNAEHFSKRIKSMSKAPVVFYSGSKAVSRSLTVHTRRQFNFSWTSHRNYSGDDIWEFTKNSQNTSIVNDLGKLGNTMPLEMYTDAHSVYSVDDATTQALKSIDAGKIAYGQRFANNAAVQQWGHDYEHQRKIGPSAQNQQALRNPATFRLGSANGTSKHFKTYNKRVNKMKSAVNNGGRVLPMQRKNRNGYWNRGNYVSQLFPSYAPSGCEMASLNMGLNIVHPRTHRRINLNTLIADAGVRRGGNPEYHYNTSPYGHGGEILPYGIARVAKDFGARKSYPLVDSALKGTKKNINAKDILAEVKRGHPVMFEGPHSMLYHTHSDHVLIIYGFKNGRVYYADPENFINRGKSTRWWGARPNRRNYWVNTGNMPAKLFFHVVNNHYYGPHATVIAK